MKLFESNNKNFQKEESGYNAESIEILKGLEPVWRRPGMYTDTTSPDHLAFEVIDNSVDEAIAGYADTITVTLYQDNSLEVADNGRGMPVDIHPAEKISGVELIMSKLHAGAKFSNKDYHFSGGLHGVGVSVVNALSAYLKIIIKRNGKKYGIAFRNGVKSKELHVIEKTADSRSGTSLRFYPDTSFFENDTFSPDLLTHSLKAKAVLCAGLEVTFYNENTGEEVRWQYEHGLGDYLSENMPAEKVFDTPFTGEGEGDEGSLSWAVNWAQDQSGNICESFVNLIPTPLGGTHVNGFRSGLLDSVREFCKFRDIIPKGVYLAPEDIWENIGFILSVKLNDAQFSGQTKERLSSRHCTNFVSSHVRDAFSLWLNQNTEAGCSLAEMVVKHARDRIRKSKKVKHKKRGNGPVLPAKLSDCTSSDHDRRGDLYRRGGTLPGDRPNRRETGASRRFFPCGEKS